MQASQPFVVGHAMTNIPSSVVELANFDFRMQGPSFGPVRRRSKTSSAAQEPTRDDHSGRASESFLSKVETRREDTITRRSRPALGPLDRVLGSTVEHCEPLVLSLGTRVFPVAGVAILAVSRFGGGRERERRTACSDMHR